MRLPILIIVGTVPLRNATPPSFVQSVRDIVANSEGIPEPIIHQPTSINNGITSSYTHLFNNPPIISDDVASFTGSDEPPTSSVPPLATELDEFYPPMAVLSIMKREKTLTHIYGDGGRPRLLRIMCK